MPLPLFSHQGVLINAWAFIRTFTLFQHVIRQYAKDWTHDVGYWFSWYQKMAAQSCWHTMYMQHHCIGSRNLVLLLHVVSEYWWDLCSLPDCVLEQYKSIIRDPLWENQSAQVQKRQCFKKMPHINNLIVRNLSHVPDKDILIHNFYKESECYEILAKLTKF